MADQLLKELGIADVTLHLNTLGDGDSREAWRGALVDYFRAVKGELSEDSQERLEKNRCASSIKDRHRPPVRGRCPKIDQFLSDDARAFSMRSPQADAAGVNGPAPKASCAGSTITGTPRSNSSRTKAARPPMRSAARVLILGGGRHDGLMESFGGPADTCGRLGRRYRATGHAGGDRGEAAADVVVVVENDRDAMNAAITALGTAERGPVMRSDGERQSAQAVRQGGESGRLLDRVL